MIDFRYLLVMIVAIFLALGIGVLMGTLGLELPEDLERRIDSVREANTELRKDVTELRSQIEAARVFAEEVEPSLIDGALAGAEVVLFDFEGTDGDIVEDLKDEVALAGGEVISVITLNGKLALGTQAERDELALILHAVHDEPTELRVQTGTKLGTAAAESASSTGDERSVGNRIEQLLEGLDGADFVDVQRIGDGDAVPQSSEFVVVGGSAEEPPFPLQELVLPLVTTLADGGQAVLVAESSESAWSLVPIVRDDGDTSDVIATVDQAETIPGQVAVVLGLCHATDGDVDHYGYASGASEVIPEQTPTC